MDKEPSQSMEQVVLEEISLWRQEVRPEYTPEQRLLDYFNNFHHKLAVAQYGTEAWTKYDLDKKHQYMINCLDNGMETQLIDVMEGMPQEEALAYFLQREYSEKYVLQTQAEINRDMNQAIDESGVFREGLMQYLQALSQNYGANANSEKYMQWLFPVFVRLREMGYSHIDLYT